MLLDQFSYNAPLYNPSESSSRTRWIRTSIGLGNKPCQGTEGQCVNWGGHDGIPIGIEETGKSSRIRGMLLGVDAHWEQIKLSVDNKENIADLAESIGAAANIKVTLEHWCRYAYLVSHLLAYLTISCCI